MSKRMFLSFPGSVADFRIFLKAQMLLLLYLQEEKERKAD